MNLLVAIFCLSRYETFTPQIRCFSFEKEVDYRYPVESRGLVKRREASCYFNFGCPIRVVLYMGVDYIDKALPRSLQIDQMFLHGSVPS
jgi:hypothetical protein